MSQEKILLLLLATTLMSSSNISHAQQNLDAHEHGSAIMNLAVDQKKFKIDFVAPGADIVGFEHPATSHNDKEKIEDALEKLHDLSNLVEIGTKAECEMTSVSANLEEERDSDSHSDHEKHEHEDEHDHEKHDHEKHEHEDEHDHEKHEHEASHSEFHAHYEFECENPGAFAINKVNYFDEFKNSVKLKLRVVSSKGPKSFDLDRKNSTVDFDDMVF